MLWFDFLTGGINGAAETQRGQRNEVGGSTRNAWRRSVCFLVIMIRSMRRVWCLLALSSLKRSMKPPQKCAT